MANTTAKPNNGKTSSSPGIVSGVAAGGGTPSGTGVSTGDSKLLVYVRSNAPYIISALSCAASRAGEQENWQEMQAYIGIANELSTQTGFVTLLSSLGGGQSRTMAARAGGSG